MRVETASAISKYGTAVADISVAGIPGKFRFGAAVAPAANGMLPAGQPLQIPSTRHDLGTGCTCAPPSAVGTTGKAATRPRYYPWKV